MFIYFRALKFFAHLSANLFLRDLFVLAAPRRRTVLQIRIRQAQEFENSGQQRTSTSPQPPARRRPLFSAAASVSLRWPRISPRGRRTRRTCAALLSAAHALPWRIFPSPRPPRGGHRYPHFCIGPRLIPPRGACFLIRLRHGNGNGTAPTWIASMHLEQATRGQ